MHDTSKSSFFWVIQPPARWKNCFHLQDHIFFLPLMSYVYRQLPLIPEDQDCQESGQYEDNILEAEHWFGHALPSD